MIFLRRAYDFTNNMYITDSFQLAEKFNNFQLPVGYIIVSFDVVSLFTNIPLTLLINSINNKWDIVTLIFENI